MGSDRESRVKVPGFDGRVREYTREGYRKDVEMIEVEEFVTAKHNALDGSGAVEVQHGQTRLRLQRKHADGVLRALAEHMGYRVEPK